MRGGLLIALSLMSRRDCSAEFEFEFVSESYVGRHEVLRSLCYNFRLEVGNWRGCGLCEVERLEGSGSCSGEVWTDEGICALWMCVRW